MHTSRKCYSKRLDTGQQQDCLRQAFNYIDKEQLKKIDKELQLNKFFIDFDYKHNAQDLLRAYPRFFNELGRYPGSLEFAIVPQGEIPNFIHF